MMACAIRTISVVALVLVGCAGGSGADDDALSKADVRGGKADASVDWCDRLGWYGDGVCDDFCARPDPDCAGPGPSASCVESVTAAVEALEGVNEYSVTVEGLELVDGHSDRELIRVTAKREGEEARYVASTETLGGDPCLVYGLAREEEAEGLVDDGASTTLRPSDVCNAATRRAVQALETLNGPARSITRTRLVAGQSDRELVRVSVGAGAARDSWLVSAETLGGDPCLVYGLQLKSQQIDLATAAAPAD